MPILPFSGQVLGAVASACGVSTEDLGDDVGGSGRNVRNYFNGQRIGEEARRSILNVLARRAMGSEMLPFAIPADRRTELTIAMEFILGAWADHWDALVSNWRVHEFAGSPARAAAASALRLFTVDFAVRFGGLAILLGTDPPEALPRWARWAIRQDGCGEFLKALKEDAGLSITEFADALDSDAISESALRKHLGGQTIPTSEHVTLFAAALSRRIAGASERAIEVELRRHYTLHRLCVRAAVAVGWPVVEEAVQFFVRGVRSVEAGARGLPGDRGGFSLLTLGAAHPAGTALRTVLGELAPDARWTEAILAAWQDWFGFMLYEVRRAQRLGNAPFEGIHRPRSAVEWSLHGYLALALRQGRTAVQYFRKAVELDDAEAEYHLDLASVLPDDQPDAVTMRAACEEALRHAVRAEELRPGWREAQLEQAIIIEDLEGPRAAERFLRKLVGGCTSREDESTLRYHVAVMALRAGRHEAALGWLRPLLRARPEHGEALNIAALCHHAIGNEREAKRCAERAAALGIAVGLPAARTPAGE